MKETFQIPTPETLEALTGKELYDLWTSLHQLIKQKYNMEQMWNHGGKKWTYEYKYRRGGKTLCALYAKEQTIGFMVILGKDERTKFESMSDNVDKINYPNFNLEAQEINTILHAEWYFSAKMPNLNETYYDKVNQLEDDMDVMKGQMVQIQQLLRAINVK